MKKVIKAKTIGDKLYNLNRVHSKVVFLNSKYNNINQKDILENQLKSFKDLKLYLNCLIPTEELKSKKEYLSSIDQFISALEREDIKNIFRRSCYMQSCFTKFKKNVLQRNTNYCQSDYDTFCLPMYILESERKSLKRNNAS